MGILHSGQIDLVNLILRTLRSTFESKIRDQPDQIENAMHIIHACRSLSLSTPEKYKLSSDGIKMIHSTMNRLENVTDNNKLIRIF